jgi:hypothetical protein
MKLSSEMHLYYLGNMPNRLGWSAMSDKMWHIEILVRFNKQQDIVTTVFSIRPPITTPRKFYKKLSFKTTSYKELCKWLKKNKDKVGKFSNLGL